MFVKINFMYTECIMLFYYTTLLDTVWFICVCVIVALEVWCSSVVERTMYFRAVKPSAAREWQKSSQPGVTTDQSAKVRFHKFLKDNKRSWKNVKVRKPSPQLLSSSAWVALSRTQFLVGNCPKILRANVPWSNVYVSPHPHATICAFILGPVIIIVKDLKLCKPRRGKHYCKHNISSLIINPSIHFLYLLNPTQGRWGG